MYPNFDINFTIHPPPTMYTLPIQGKTIEYIRVDGDIYGNPRYYIPLSSIMQYLPDMPTVDDYIRAINKKKSALTVYRGKKYWYWYIMQSYSIESEIEEEITRHILA